MQWMGVDKVCVEELNELVLTAREVFLQKPRKAFRLRLQVWLYL